MATATMTDVYTTLRARLLSAAQAGSGDTLTALLSGRLYNDQPPADAVFPYGVLRLPDLLTTGVDGSMRLAGDLELMLWGRPASTRAAMRHAGDVALSALRTWATTSGGLIKITDARVQMLPAPPSPADSEVVQVRVVATLFCWPQFLTP